MRQRRAIELEELLAVRAPSVDSHYYGEEERKLVRRGVSSVVPEKKKAYFTHKYRRQGGSLVKLVLLFAGAWLLLELIRPKLAKYQKYTATQLLPPIQQPSDTYHVLRCPELPPPGYPREYPILEVLNNWNTKRVDPKDRPKTIYQGICVFDLSTTTNRADLLLQKQIQNYRAAEVPFVVRNDPAVLQAVALWNQSGYLENKLDEKTFEATISNSAIMTYFSMDPNYNEIPKDFTSPTRKVPMSFQQWKQRATTSAKTSTSTLERKNNQREYAYLRLDACLSGKDCDAAYRGNPHQLDNADFIYKDLSFLQPDHSQYYNIEANWSRGVQCRFAEAGITAEDHFDNERNYIVLLKGERRFLLGHPKNCPTMHLFPQKHPLERHSQLDWSDPDLTRFPGFVNTTINEVVLQAGDVLYLPTYWFHHIVSLSLNYQCSTRSGYSVEYDQIIYDCGFFYDFPSYQS